jgi:hypothetical protein
MRDCHKKQEDEDIKAAKAASKVNLADATEGIKYVYMSHVTTDQNTIKEAASPTEASHQSKTAKPCFITMLLPTFFCSNASARQTGERSITLRLKIATKIDNWHHTGDAAYCRPYRPTEHSH